MKWFSKFHPEEVDEQESIEALKSAQEARKKAESTRREVEKISASLRVLRQDNHFAEAVRRAMLGEQ